MVKENRRTAVYSEEMEQKVLELAEQPSLDIFLLIFDGGIRPQESLSLEWSDPLWDKNLIRVRGTKSEGSNRHVPMSDRVKQTPGSVPRLRRIGSCSPRSASRMLP